MTSLIEFVEARLDEDKAIARAAYGETEQDWTIDTDPDLPAKHVQGRPSIKTSGMGWQTTSGDGIWSCDDPEDDCRIYRREDKADAEHIVHFDPARVLREVEAKRAIIADHSSPRAAFLAADPFVGTGTRQSRRQMGEWCDHHEDFECQTLKLLAAPYSDHPDYNPEWSTT